jgi:hypothetical protein
MTDGADVTKEQADDFGKRLSDIITNRLNDNKPRPFNLRMSNIGKGARQLWYMKNYPNEDEKFTGQTLLKFLLGDVVEHILLFLAKVSGHRVSSCQAEVVLGGVKGHIDADIDGVTVDVKSASPYAFKKFKDGTLAENDAFGYIEQISGYSKARDTDGAFLAMEKVTGELAYLPFTKEELNVFNVEQRIEHLKEVIKSDVEPERCHTDEEMGTSGNRKLGVNCSYCPYKNRCWQGSNGGIGLRTFIYSTGPVFMTHVAKEPKVYEKSW